MLEQLCLMRKGMPLLTAALAKISGRVALWLAVLPVMAMMGMIGFSALILAFTAVLDLVVAGPLPWPLSAYRVFLDWMVG